LIVSVNHGLEGITHAQIAIPGLWACNNSATLGQSCKVASLAVNYRPLGKQVPNQTVLSL